MGLLLCSIKKSYVNISMLNFILTIIAVLITAGLALVISDNQKIGKNLLAAGSTIGVFYALGTTVYWFCLLYTSDAADE